MQGAALLAHAVTQSAGVAALSYACGCGENEVCQTRHCRGEQLPKHLMILFRPRLTPELSRAALRPRQSDNPTARCRGREAVSA
jgi:hypothetical protein